jgi:transposase
MLDAITIRRYEKEYKEKGIDGLLENRYHGRKGSLPEIDIRSLENHLRVHTYTTQSKRLSCM